MIRIFINDNLVGIPEPVVGEADIGWSHAERETGELKARGTATSQSEDMPFPNTSREPAVFPRMVKMVAGVLSTALVDLGPGG
jgi:hypothetical protein